MPLFKFAPTGESITGTGAFGVPAPVFLSFGEVLGREGDVEFLIPSLEALFIGEGHIGFTVPVADFTARGNEIADSSFLVALPKLLADGHVAVFGAVTFNVPSSILSALGENTGTFSIPATRFSLDAVLEIVGESTFNVSVPVFQCEAVIAQHGAGGIKITLPSLAAIGQQSVIGVGQFLVPCLYLTAAGTVGTALSSSDETDVILTFERRRRLI
jgi:hypothetical protein